MTTYNGDRVCYHCGSELSNSVLGGKFYPSDPYRCPKHGGSMEQWEGIKPEDVTDDDRQRWANGCDCLQCRDDDQ